MALLQTIEWRDVTGEEIVHRWPAEGSGNIILGSQLVVRESQNAVFFRDGQALDVFGPAAYPHHAHLPSWHCHRRAFWRTTPFQAGLFLNMRVFTDLSGYA